MFYVFAILCFLTAVVLRWRWAGRRDVWVHMHGAVMFQRGDSISLHSTREGVPARGIVRKVTRSALLVRPL